MGDNHVRCLLASVSLAYPIGAVMMLEQSNSRQIFKPRLFDGVTSSTAQLSKSLILDGQQRLTALFMVLLSEQPVTIKKTKKQKLTKKWYYLDIEKSLQPEIDRKTTIIALPESKVMGSRKSD
ncbi:MAG: DUF262 domain-containing protein, partial [Cyanobacteria bacterium J06641_2]